MAIKGPKKNYIVGGACGGTSDYTMSEPSYTSHITRIRPLKVISDA